MDRRLHRTSTALTSIRMIFAQAIRCLSELTESLGSAVLRLFPIDKTTSKQNGITYWRHSHEVKEFPS